MDFPAVFIPAVRLAAALLLLAVALLLLLLALLVLLVGLLVVLIMVFHFQEPPVLELFAIPFAVLVCAVRLHSIHSALVLWVEQQRKQKTKRCV